MKRRFPVYPLLFAVFPVVFLYARNVRGEVSPRDLVAPVIVSISAACLLTAILRRVFGDVHRAAVATSVVVVVAFSFGHVNRAIDPLDVGRFETALLIESGLVVTAAFVALVVVKRTYARVSGVLNPVAAALCVLNIVPIVAFEMGTTDASLPTDPLRLSLDAAAEPRDIYYLIFDRYASGWRRDPFALRNAGAIPADELRAAHQQAKSALVRQVNAMTGGNACALRGSARVEAAASIARRRVKSLLFTGVMGAPVRAHTRHRRSACWCNPTRPGTRGRPGTSDR